MSRTWGSAARAFGAVACAWVGSVTAANACQCVIRKDIKTPSQMHEYLMRRGNTPVEACITRIGPLRGGDCAGCAVAKATIRVLETTLEEPEQDVNLEIIGCSEEVQAVTDHLRSSMQARKPVIIYIHPDDPLVVGACYQPDVMAGANRSLLDDTLPERFRRSAVSC
jgi:hypothetical protein